MNNTDFTYILQNPEIVTHQQTDDIKSIIQEFPYFQSARALYLKGLKSQESFKYNQELKATAAYTTDRSILFDFITSDAFIQNEISQLIKQNSAHLRDIDVDVEDISSNKSVSIDNKLEEQLTDTSSVLDPNLFEPKIPRPKIVSFDTNTPEPIENDTEQTNVLNVPASDVLNLGKPLQFEKKETHSFNEWLKLTHLKPIERETPIQNTPHPISPEPHLDKDRAKKFDLINEFISKNPKITPVKSFTSNHNIAKSQMIEPEALMTETLARIYVEQKNYKKAIQSYKILSLKYPEKSSFFANQIEAVKQLQEHNNKE